MIRKIKGKWVIISHTKPRKVLGIYDTFKEAKQRLEEIVKWKYLKKS